MTRTLFSMFALVAAALVILMATTAVAQTTQPAPAVAPVEAVTSEKPTTAMPADSCATPDCHGNVKDHRVLHGPVNVNGCEACHTLTDPATHTYALARQGPELCTFCHQVDTTDPVVHKPLADGQCVSCHDPHGGRTQRFVRGDSMEQLCNTCHQDVTAGKANVHGPVAAGACDSCHRAHSSPFPNLLATQGTDSCLSCHVEMKQQMAEVAFTHEAVEQDCVNCHDPHASNYVMQIKQPPLQLCSSCHEDERQAAMDAKFTHPVVVEGDACLNCHTAHGGDLAQLMKDDPIDVCMSCHAEPIERDGQAAVASVAEVTSDGMIKHGPIRDGNCAGCHDTHGSDESRLLTRPYPEPFYQSFELDKYGLCFSCHDEQLVLAAKAEGLTGFRNGQTNLHYMHVNKEKGRNCRACHQSHASPNELHVRESVPFGNWQMPVNFTKSDTGGSCSPGCHKQYTYDRETPVKYDAPGTNAPATPAGASTAAASVRGGQ